MLFSLLLTHLALSANQAPEIKVLRDVDPILVDHGEGIQLPIEVTDADGDPIRLFYKFNDATEWNGLPFSDTPNILPGRIFADLDPNVDHVIHLYASDGMDDSKPVQLGWFKRFFKRIGRKIKAFAKKVWKVAKKVLKTVAKVAVHIVSKVLPIGGGQPPPQEQPGAGGQGAEGQPPAQAHGITLPATLQSLRTNSIGVSYSFDDSGEWSESVRYPLGDMEILISHDDFQKYAGEGNHKITLRFEEDADHVDTDVFEYVINEEPVVKATSTETLSFKGVPTGPVTLPLTVTDADGDDVGLWYRFDGQGDWTYIPAGEGVNTLPAEAFAGRQAGSSGFVEVAAYDGYDHSDQRVRIAYAIEGDGQADENEGVFGVLSPAAFAGIIIGAVAVVAVAIAVIVVATRKKQESSSTGLIDSE